MQKLRKYGVFTLALAMSASALIPTARHCPTGSYVVGNPAGGGHDHLLVPGPEAKPAGAEPR